MSMFVSTSRRRRSLFGLAGVVVAAGFFASGVLVANARDDDAPPTQHQARPLEVAKDGSGAMPATTNAGSAPTMGLSFGTGNTPDARSMPVQGGCSAPLPGMLNGNTVNLATGGMSPRFPGAGFELESVTVRGDVPCGATGVAPVPLLETRWRHTETGFELTLQQRSAEKPGPSVVRQGWAQAYADGYVFTVMVSGNPVIMDGGGPLPAADMPVKPAIYPGPDADPRVAALIDQVLGTVAPSLDAKCYYRQVQGTWADLAGVGIGDPRPALPAGFDAATAQFHFLRMIAPAPDCDAPELGSQEPSVMLNVSFSNAKGFLNISANSRMGQDGPQIGHADEGNINWQNAMYWFSVSGQTAAGSSVTRAELEKLAKALDLSFGTTCIVSSRVLSEADAAPLGFHVPATPDGYRKDGFNLAAVESNGACGSHDIGYAMSWVFFSEAKASVIEAGVTRNLPDGDPRGYSYLGEGSLLWKDATGATYHVSGLKMPAPRETLIAVARSMDPNFDESKLIPPTEITPPGPKTMPAAPPTRGG